MSKEPVSGTVIENPATAAGTSPVLPTRPKRRASLSPIREPPGNVEEVVDEAIEEFEESPNTPQTPPRRKLMLQAISLDDEEEDVPVSPTRPRRPSSPPSSPLSPPSFPSPTSPARIKRTLGGSSVTFSVEDVSSPAETPSPDKKENGGFFAKLGIFQRKKSYEAKPEVESKVHANSGEGGDEIIENIPKRSWTSRLCLTMEPPKLEQIKKWTVMNYKYTKQLVSEKFGHSTRTIDKELEERIAELRLSKVQYGNMLKEARAMYTRFEALLASHRSIRAQFQTLIAHSPDLQDQLQANATTQSILEKNGEGLLGAIRTFVDTVNTLVNVTIQDTFLTIKNYENARIEYDAYRNDIDTLQIGPQTDATKNKLLELQVIYENRKQKWERLKQDTNTKLDLLAENKSMVMKTQLEMFNAAVVAYFSGNGDKLSEVLSEYHVKARKTSEDGDATSKSFLARNE